METFQRMNGLDADALRLIHRRFQDIDTVRVHVCHGFMHAIGWNAA